jgi:acetyl-CoA acetyltransferase
MAAQLGLGPRWLIDNVGIMAGPLPIVCAAIAAGACDTVAMVYAVAPSKLGRIFGGQNVDGPPNPPSYYYYHPWGWSSQAAHWAFAWRHYQTIYSATEADLGAVAVQLRENALANSNAVMTAPMTIEDYLASRYIVHPLHLFDMCMVNDGAVCLIVRRADMARDMPHAPVLVTGWGEARVTSNKMHGLVRERLRPQFDKAGGEALAMAGVAIRDVQHFEGYDAATSHLITQLEGHGFVEPGSGLEFCKAGEMAVGGALPVNTAGGMISGSYMHGWNHVAEITRQLRHEAGMRQIEGVEISMSSLTQTDQVHPILFRRGA